MARARMLKPGFFKNEELAQCDPLARLLFEGLWCLADREGRLEDRPLRIKVEILPYDNTDINQLLDQLASHDLIIRYQADGQRFIQVVTFKKNQHCHVNELPSEIPAPEGFVETSSNGASTWVQEPEDLGANPPLTISLTKSLSLSRGTAVASDVPAPPPKEKATKAFAIPEDFAPSDEMLLGARKKYPAMDIALASESWCNAMRANKSKYKYTDWRLAWWNGMQKADGWNQHRLGGNSSGNNATVRTSGVEIASGETQPKGRVPGLRAALEERTRQAGNA